MINSFKNHLTANFIFQNLFVPNVLITIYSGILAILLSSIKPSLTINFFFSYFIFKLSLISLLIIIAGLAFLIFIKEDRSIKFKAEPEKKSRNDYLLLLIPLTPIVNYLYKNKEILSVYDVVIIFLLLITVLFVFIILLPKILDKFSPIRNLKSISTAFFFTIFNMAIISGVFFWLEKGSFKIQLGLFLISLLLIWFLLGLKKSADMSFLILTFFVGNCLLLIVPQKNAPTPTYLPSDSFTENKLINSVKGKQIETKPNIYFLIYDAYVPNETMLSYGIDNSDQENYLKNQDFVLYPKTYSVGSSTLSSMNKVFNVSIEPYGHIVRAVAGDGIVQKILRENGYKVSGIFPSDYMFRSVGPLYDDYFPKKAISSYKLLLTGILIGEFRFDIGLRTINHDEYIKYKRDFFNQKTNEPFFIYTHSDLPDHSQNSGKCLENEIDLFKDRLDEANQEMKQDISLILEHDPGAILIVAGDHGPYLTKNCTATNGSYDKSEISRVDIQDRFGTFLAIKWPSDDYELYDQIVVLQDLFPSIFAYLYKDPSILQSKIEPNTLDAEYISGVSVKNGTIIGGIDDGELLFLYEQEQE